MTTNEQLQAEQFTAYRIEVRSATGWAGQPPRGWQPAIDGAANQVRGAAATEASATAASTFDTEEEAQRVVDDVVRPQMANGDEVRIVEVELPSVTEVVIRAVAGGNEYEVVGNDDRRWDEDELADTILESDGDVYELGVSVPPAEVEDIRGRIRNEPARVFAVVNKGQVSYVGIRR